jgi:hypothetical protein
MKTHFRDTRLYNNAGMLFPTCYAGAVLLDTNKSWLPTTNNQTNVTCQHCLRKLGYRRDNNV